MVSQQLDFTPWPECAEQHYRKQGYWQDRTLFDYLTETKEQYPHSLALVSGSHEYTYQELYQKSLELASGFTSIGLNSGDTVVLQMTNSAEFYFCFFALTICGVKPVLALPAHRSMELRYFCNHTKAKAYIFSDQIAGFDAQKTALTLLEDCPSLETIVTTGQPSNAKVKTLNTLYMTPCKQQEGMASDVAFYQLSGGTTGTPKLIPRTHNDYAYSVIGSIDICQFSSTTNYLCVLPVAHNFPLSSPGALGVFFSGGCVILSHDTMPQHAFSLIEKHQVTVTALVPPLALLWMQYVDTATEDISSLELVQVGGAKFSEAAAKQLPNKLNCQLQQVFGMAEGLVNYTRLDDPIDIITGTQGRPISPDDELLVVDENGENVPFGHEGQLLTRGPYTVRGYYRAKEHNQRAFNHTGFYLTGDLVKMTAEGNITVTGRDKDQINRGGEKIAAEEIENILLQHHSVHDAALIAIKDTFLGERSCAIIVLKQEETIKPIALKRFLHNKGLAEYKIPDHIHFVNTLPKTSVGKINKKQLREQFSAN